MVVKQVWDLLVEYGKEILVEYGGKASLGHLPTAKTWPTLVSAILRRETGGVLNWGNFGREFKELENQSPQSDQYKFGMK